MKKDRRPTPEEIRAAEGKTIRDVIADELEVLFCGINPSLYTAAVGHHFARPGNRFWPALHASGFTPRLFAPSEEVQLLGLGLGITNLVPRATARADQLDAGELVAGAHRLSRKLARRRPRYLAVLGVQAFRAGFDAPGAAIGLQPRPIADTPVWLLPNPSGLNAHFTPTQLAVEFARLRTTVLLRGGE